MGMPADWLTTAMFSRVWEATCPQLSPVMIALARLRLASTSVIRTMNRR